VLGNLDIRCRGGRNPDYIHYKRVAVTLTIQCVLVQLLYITKGAWSTVEMFRDLR
jgi:hypothetical protein